MNMKFTFLSSLVLNKVLNITGITTLGRLIYTVWVGGDMQQAFTNVYVCKFNFNYSKTPLWGQIIIITS